MHTELQNFLARLFRIIVLTLLPVALLAFLTMPASLHHHIGTPDAAQDLAPQHMS